MRILPEQLREAGHFPWVLEVAGSRVRFWISTGADRWKRSRGDQAAAKATKPRTTADFILKVVLVLVLRCVNGSQVVLVSDRTMVTLLDGFLEDLIYKMEAVN